MEIHEIITGTIGIAMGIISFFLIRMINEFDARKINSDARADKMMEQLQMQETKLAVLDGDHKNTKDSLKKIEAISEQILNKIEKLNDKLNEKFTK